MEKKLAYYLDYLTEKKQAYFDNWDMDDYDYLTLLIKRTLKTR